MDMKRRRRRVESGKGRGTESGVWSRVREGRGGKTYMKKMEKPFYVFKALANGATFFSESFFFFEDLMSWLVFPSLREKTDY